MLLTNCAIFFLLLVIHIVLIAYICFRNIHSYELQITRFLVNENWIIPLTSFYYRNFV